MAESVTFQSATLATIPDGSKVAADIIATEIYQRVKTTWGVDGVATDVSVANPLPVTAVVTGTVTVSGTVTTTATKAATGTQSSVAATGADQTILAANANRLGGSVFNDSTAILYLLLSNATSSVTAFSAKLIPNDYYEIPFNYTGVVKGFYASATGSARVMEFTA